MRLPFVITGRVFQRLNEAELNKIIDEAPQALQMCGDTILEPLGVCNQSR